MGCDIHFFVEYRDKKRSPEYWVTLTYGGSNPGRNYDLFGLMAGVRRGTAMFPTRGVPANPSFVYEGHQWLFVCDDSNEENTTDRKRAERWVAQGSSKWKDDSKQRVSNPDCHSHSWLTLEEFRLCLYSCEYVDAEYWAWLAAMERLELQGYETRVVFCFDN